MLQTFTLTDYSAFRNMYKISLRTVSIAMCIVLWIGVLAIPQSSHAADFPNQISLTIHYDPADKHESRLVNAQIAFKQLQIFLAEVQFSAGVSYSFNHDVLGSSPLRSQGYVDTPIGFAYGINDAASALNLLFHRAQFWGTDGTQKRVFETVQAIPVKNDRTFGAFAVAAATNTVDYVWRLNLAYAGAAPKIEAQFDAANATITLTMSYSEAGDPARPVSIKDRLSGLKPALESLIGERRFGLSVIDTDDPAIAINVNEDAEVPIASAWKGPGIIYFFENVSPTVWSSVPVRYWHVTNIADVPIEYQDALLKNRAVLWDVYTMAVFSGNHEAGDVLAYVFRQLPRNKPAGSNPIMAFNDWSQRSVGISAASGMYNWDYGDLENNAIYDPHFARRQLEINGNGLFYANMFSAHDLALFYLHLATIGKAQGYYQPAVDLLSIRNPIVSKIEGETPGTDIRTATKDGYFDPGSPLSREHSVNNDAGLLFFPDGRVYAVAFTAFDAVDIEGDVIDHVLQTLN